MVKVRNLYKVLRESCRYKTWSIIGHLHLCTYVHTSLITIVTYVIVGIDMKNMTSHIFALPQHASQYTLPEKPTEIHWLHMILL